MIERIVTKRNMLAACRQVVSNKGAAGVDGLGVRSLADHLRVHGEGLATAVCAGSYLPQAILGVAIPKSKGGTRLLGIPTVTVLVLPTWPNTETARAACPRIRCLPLAGHKRVGPCRSERTK
jgi:hypothetical protein